MEKLETYRMYFMVNGFAVNGWDLERAKEAVQERAEKNNEWYVLDSDLVEKTEDYDSIEFSDAKTAYQRFDQLKETLKPNHRLEVIWSADQTDELVKGRDNVVVLHYSA